MALIRQNSIIALYLISFSKYSIIIIHENFMSENDPEIWDEYQWEEFFREAGSVMIC